MIARAALTLIAISIAAPASADWTHKESGVSVPDAIGDMRRHDEKDLSNGQRLDVMIQYGTETEPVTLYVYRSSYPNPALWLERTQTAMLDNVGRFDGGAAGRTLAIGGTALNTVRAEYPLAGKPWKSTAVAIIQDGEWLVKARATSQTLDPAGIAQRMDRLLAAIRFATPPADSTPLTVPGACSKPMTFTGKAKPDSAIMMAGAVMGAAAYGNARGMAAGLAREPAGWCRVVPADPAQSKMATVYRRNDGTAWTALLGDSGISLSAFDLERLKGGKGAATYLVHTGVAQLVATYDALPDLIPALTAAVPVLRGQAKPLVEVGVSKN